MSEEKANGDDFPLVCNTCLGDNPFVRMTKLPLGHKLCKITNLPYQAFRWKAGQHGRVKETVISFAVARDRNICQACLNDLKYGLPSGVRDSVIKDNQRKRKLEGSQSSSMIVGGGSDEAREFLGDVQNLAATRELQQFAQAKSVPSSSASKQNSSTAFRNLPKLCTFWLNGTCRRVETKRCPFRPCCGTFEFPELARSRPDLCTKLKARLSNEGPIKVQLSLESDVQEALRQALKGNKDEAIRKRVAGEDDLSQKYLDDMQSMGIRLPPPSDPTITTLYLGNIDATITEQDIAGVIYPYGQYTSIRINRASNCAFIDYIDRNNAEYAAACMYNALTINGRSISVGWAKSKATQQPIQTYPQPFVPSMQMPQLHYYPNIQYPAPPLPAFPAVIPGPTSINDGQIIHDQKRQKHK